MSRYESSIKCKYCSHFEPGANHCHLYHDFDQSVDKSGGLYYKDTVPDSRCSHFKMTAMDTVASGMLKNRPDGSYLVSLDDDPELKQQLERVEHGNSGSNRGCYVATCVYGSYDCPQVWTLRRFRDYQLASTWYGRAFIRTYYAISPALVRWFGETTWFKRFWRGKLDAMIERLQRNGVESTPYQDK